ncbi:DUF6285 domain-containing protein [Pseudacidovorax sp. NFM-22]|uniref:DUF6285 domain-containing protein n=1 Tax=Pseudacidovorax sp. NFM-22 TaxID=2744469 RepID=UPI001F1A68E7|nr:DUF6285 domain-containing protein [Pseudacidovorax sp. NFM-22]
MSLPVQPEEILAAAQAAIEAAVRKGEGAGRSDFDLRVAARLLAVLQREQRQGRAAEAAERAGLLQLLRTQGMDDTEVDAEAEPAGANAPALDALRQRLCEGIAAGRLPADDPALCAHLWHTTLARLAIDNPAYRW